MLNTEVARDLLLQNADTWRKYPQVCAATRDFLVGDGEARTRGNAEEDTSMLNVEQTGTENRIWFSRTCQLQTN